MNRRFTRTERCVATNLRVKYGRVSNGPTRVRIVSHRVIISCAIGAYYLYAVIVFTLAITPVIRLMFSPATRRQAADRVYTGTRRFVFNVLPSFRHRSGFRRFPRVFLLHTTPGKKKKKRKRVSAKRTTVLMVGNRRRRHVRSYRETPRFFSPILISSKRQKEGSR